MLSMPSADWEIAYIAGLFDGEGCVTRANGRPIVQIGMTSEPVIAWLAEIGGTVRIEQPPGNRKPLHRWRILAANEVEEFLRAIYPYLRVKQQDAEDAIVEIEGPRLVHEATVAQQVSLW